MKIEEGRVVILEDGYMIVSPYLGYKFMYGLVAPHEIPLDFDKNFNSFRVLFEYKDGLGAITDENGFAKLHKKTQNLRELFSLFGPSKEIKQRMSNGQLKINNKVIKSFDVEVNIDFDWETHKLVELSDFLMDSGLDLGQLVKMKAFGIDIMDFFGSPTLNDGPTNIKKFEFLENYVLVSISKKEHYVFKNKVVDGDDIPYYNDDLKKDTRLY
jgi:hypothetical protein